jgi:hypothetical protein
MSVQTNLKERMNYSLRVINSPSQSSIFHFEKSYLM